MATNSPARPGCLKYGESARLIPVVADCSKEQRVVSALLAVMSSVDEFGKGLLRALGAPATKSSRIECFTEVIFLNNPDTKCDRPDGLIIVTYGAKTWMALVEAKIGNGELNAGQIESYLDLAKENGIDAVITITNQYVPLPTHHPIRVDKRKVRSTELYHWSWMYLVSEAVLATDNKGISDPDQAYVLSELVRYLQHESSGILSFSSMGPCWKDLCADVLRGAPLVKGSPTLESVMGSWYQLTRYVALQLSVSVGKSVMLGLPKEHVNDPERRLRDDMDRFLKALTFEAELIVPDAASRIKFSADVKGRAISASMHMEAPKDKVRPQSRINWIVSQLNDCSDETVLVKANWAYSPPTIASLGQLRESRESLLPQEIKKSTQVSSFEIFQIRDLAGKFSGSRTFVESAQGFPLLFYENVGQRLKRWQPAPPKIKVLQPKERLEGGEDGPKQDGQLVQVSSEAGGLQSGPSQEVKWNPFRAVFAPILPNGKGS